MKADNSPALHKAIEAALSDISLLRLLVAASDADKAYQILNQHNSSITFNGQDKKEFFRLLKKGNATITAKTLVELFDGLVGFQPPPVFRRKEWAP